MSRHHLLGSALLTAALACGPETGSGDMGVGGTGSTSSVDPSSGTSAADGQTTIAADGGSSSTGGTTAGPGPTPAECFALETEDDCEAAGCTQWSPARVVSTAAPDSCECSEPYGVCLLFEGSVGTGSFRRSWVFESEPETVVELQPDYTRAPLGWTPCEEISDPPAACGCFDTVADNCNTQPGTTG